MKVITNLLILLFVSVSSFAGSKQEVLEYSIRFGLMKGGEASITTTRNSDLAQGLVFSEMKIRTTGLTHALYSVENTYSCHINTTSFFPENAKYQIHEQQHVKNDEVAFYQQSDSLYSKKSGGHSADGSILDMVSLIYNFRYSDRLSKLKVGDIISVPFWDLDKMYTLQLKFAGKEKIKTKAGSFQCFRVEPVFDAGSSFSTKSPISIWISNDARKLPVLICLNFNFGSVKCELQSY